MAKNDKDELEHLRALLAHAYDEPRRGKGVRTIMRRLAQGFFVTPREVIIERIQQDLPPKKDAA